MDTYSRKSFLRKQAYKKAGSIFLISTRFYTSASWRRRVGPSASWLVTMWSTVRCIMQYFLMKVFLIQLKWDFLYNLTLLTLNYCKKADFASFPEQLSNSVNFSHFWSSGTSKIVCWENKKNFFEKKWIFKWKGMVNNLKNLKPICLLSCFFSLFFYVMLLGLISLICLIS